MNIKEEKVYTWASELQELIAELLVQNPDYENIASRLGKLENQIGYAEVRYEQVI